MKYKRLTDEQAKLLMQLTVSKEPDYESFKREFYEDYPIGILLKRIEVCKLPRLEPSAIIMITSLADGNPGKMILGLIDTLNKAEDLYPEKIDVRFIGMNVYPFGFYTEEAASAEYDERRYPPKGKDGKPVYKTKYDYLFF